MLAISNIHKLLVLWKIGAIFRRTQLEVMLEYLDIDKVCNTCKILDVGCGHGLVDLEIARYGSLKDLFLLDISFRDLLIARAILSAFGCNTHILQASATHLPFRSNVFDRVLLSSVLQHVPNCYDALKEASRVLRKNGILVLNVPSGRPYIFLPKILGKRIANLILYSFNMHHTFNPKKLLLRLQKLGLQIVEYRYVPSLLSIFIFEIVAFLMMLEKIYKLKFSKLVAFLSLLFPITSFIEKLLRLSIGTEYTIKAIKIR